MLVVKILITKIRKANLISQGQTRKGITSKNIPDSIDIIILDKTNQHLISVPYLNEKFIYTIKNVLYDFSYWAEYQSKSILDPWDKIESLRHDIYVIKRTRINSINLSSL